MTALALLALGCAVLVLPAARPEPVRLAALTGAGRLVAAGRRGRVRPRTTVSLTIPLVVASAAAAAASVGVLVAPLLGVAAGALVATTGGLGMSALNHRRSAARRRSLIATIRMLTADIQAGSRAGPALLAAAASCPAYSTQLTAAGRAADSGADSSAVLLASGEQELHPLAHAWRVAEVSGAPLVEVLGRLVDDLAGAETQRLAVATALAGPRSSSGLLAVLPVLGLLLGAAMGAQPLVTLFQTPAGRLLCCVGVALDIAGVLWTHRLMRRAEAR